MLYVQLSTLLYILDGSGHLYSREEQQGGALDEAHSLARTSLQVLPDPERSLLAVEVYHRSSGTFQPWLWLTPAVVDQVKQQASRKNCRDYVAQRKVP